MSRHIDKEALVTAVMSSTELDNEQKSQLIRLIREQKKYGLVWEDSTEDAWEKMNTSIPVLNEVDDKRILNDKDGEHYPNHAIIEADNLHALIALTYTHAGMIDVIYIDPPYNTGHNDFTYNDSYVDSEDSFKHSKWLSFIEKRLRIAKALLSDRGMIFISIDDNEDAQLKLLCDEIFMNRNKVSDIIWQSRKSVSNDTFVSQNHNYTLVYAKNISMWDKSEFKLPTKTTAFNNPDNDPRGPWVADPFDAPNLRPNLTYPIVNPNTGTEYWPPKGRCWRTTEEQYKEFLADNRIVFGKKGTSKPQLKRFQDFAIEKGETPISIWNDIETTTNGTKLLQSIFGGEKVFSNPKPVELIKRIMMLIGKKNLTILDFFAGSGTTLHATMQLNAEDGGHRQCILVTNNENNICEEVTYERNKRVIEGYTTPKGEHVAGLSHNNLRYYKLGFTPREKTDKNMLSLAIKSIPLLCIKNDIYQEIPQLGHIENMKKGYRYFKEGERQMLVILDADLIGEIVKELEQTEVAQPIKTYVFTTGHYPYTEDFESVRDKVDLYPIPHSIYGACEKHMPPMDDMELQQPEGVTLSAEEENLSMDDYNKED